MRDRCPQCGHRFGVRGAPFTLPAKGVRPRRPRYLCPACSVRLRRIEAPLERFSAWVGSIALLAASAGMLWYLLEVAVKPSRGWLLALYAIAVAALAVNLLFGLTRQHFVVDAEPAPDQPPP
ncbi:MAG: hypothetical protein QNJ91_12325 [Gammaproteobacteria bacterium]|nr:hypothetical protein [Gammaproteobacteria bacterium]